MTAKGEAEAIEQVENSTWTIRYSLHFFRSAMNR